MATSPALAHLSPAPKKILFQQDPSSTPSISSLDALLPSFTHPSSLSFPCSGHSSHLWLHVIAVCLASFSFGFHLSVINSPWHVFRDCNESMGGFLSLPVCFPISSTLWGLVVAILCIGGLLGSLVGGRLADQVGRRRALLIAQVPALLGYLLTGLAVHPMMLLAGRFTSGLGCGLISVMVPMLLSEVSPLAIRGTVGTCHQLAVVFGIVWAQWLGMFWSVNESWRLLWLVGGCAPALLHILLLMTVTVESPRWCMANGHVEQARKCLEQVRPKNWPIEAEMDELELVCPFMNDASETTPTPATVEVGRGSTLSPGIENVVLKNTETEMNSSKSLTLTQLLAMPEARRSLLAAVGIHFAQQLSGINAVFFFSTELFSQTGARDLAALLTTLLGAFNVIMTIASVYWIDRAGRRRLLLCSSGGMAISGVTLLLASAFQWTIVHIAAVFAYVAAFAIGLGPIAWSLVSEIVPTRALAATSSLAVTANWSTAFVIAMTFDVLAAQFGTWLFAPYTAVCAISWWVIWWGLPETRGRPVAFL